MTEDEYDQLWRIICAMMSNGCCPCSWDMCDCWYSIPLCAAREIALYVK